MYRIKFLNTQRGQLAVALGAYIVGDAWHSEVVDAWFKHGAGRDDVIASGTLLPDCAPTSFRRDDGSPDPRAIWNAADRTGISANKRHKRPTWKKRAQVGMHVFGTLPPDTSEEIYLQIIERHADEYRRRGAAVTWSIHRPTDPGSRNHHFHLLVSTREVTANGFGRQLRNLATSFSRGVGHERATIHKDSPPKRWRAWLENFAREHGLEFELDDPFAVAGVHWNEGPHGIVSRNKALDAEAFAAAQATVRDPRQLLELITARQAVFTRRDLRRILRRHKIPDDEAESIVEKALSDPQILHLRDAEADTHRELFTTVNVRAQEMRILEAARRIHGRAPDAQERLKLGAAMGKLGAGRRLSTEQRKAMEHCVGTDGLAVVQGLAGAGKSFTMSMIREVLELTGYRVIGVAPTNAVASDMASDGFETASTIHQELLRQESGTGWHVPWNGKTCIIVDEAAMLDAGIYERLLTRAAAAGARLVLVGDDKQLSSIERGGIYAHLRKTFGCALLREVRRQNEDWAKEASLCFAEGRILEGLKAYDARGYITHHDDIAAAAEALIRQRAMDRAADPGKPRFVVAATRDAVRNLNQQCQKADWAQTPPSQTNRFKTADGEIDLGIGDRVQFAANEKKLGIVNGLLGTVVAMTAEEITIRADSGRTITFDPTSFDKWGLGFAGTVFRSQGRTHAQVYCLYDHTFAWGASTSYVAFTRHRESVRCYVPRNLAPDVETLARQMSKSDPRTSSLEFLSEEELRGEIRPGPAMAEAGATRTEAPVKTPHLALQSEIVIPGRPASVATPTRPVRTSADKGGGPDSTIVPAVLGPSSGAGASSKRRVSPLPAMPYLTRFQGVERKFDLSLRADQDELLEALAHEPKGRVAEVYREIGGPEPKDKTARDAIAGLRGRITSASAFRAFFPSSGQIIANCLEHSRLDRAAIMDAPSIQRRKGEVDIRPLLQPLYEVNPAVDRHLAAWIEGFCIEAKRKIFDSLHKACERSKGDEELQLAITNRISWYYGVCYRSGDALLMDNPVTPEVYRREYLPLGEKAARAAGDAGAFATIPVAAEPKQFRPRLLDHDWIRDQCLRSMYRERLSAQIARAEASCAAAKEARKRKESNATLEAARADLLRLRSKLKSFETSIHQVTWTSYRERPIDFLPAHITEEDVAPPKGMYSTMAGFRPPDMAREILGRLLDERMFPQRESIDPRSSASPPQQRERPIPGYEKEL